MVENEQKRIELKKLIDELITTEYGDYFKFKAKEENNDYYGLYCYLFLDDQSNFIRGIRFDEFIGMILSLEENKNGVKLSYNNGKVTYDIDIKDFEEIEKYRIESYSGKQLKDFFLEYKKNKDNGALSIEVGDKKIEVDYDSIYGQDRVYYAGINAYDALTGLYSVLGDKVKIVGYYDYGTNEEVYIDLAQGKRIEAPNKEDHLPIENDQSNEASEEGDEVISDSGKGDSQSSEPNISKGEDESGRADSPENNNGAGSQTEGTNPQPKGGNGPRNGDPNNPSQMTGGKVSADAIFDGLAQVPGIKNINYKTATGNTLNTPVYYSNDGRNMEVTSVNGFVSVSGYLQLLKLIPGVHLDATLSDDSHYSVDLNPVFTPTKDGDNVRRMTTTSRTNVQKVVKERSKNQSKNKEQPKNNDKANKFKTALKVAGATVLASALAVGFANIAKAPIINQPANPNLDYVDNDLTPVNPITPVTPTPVKPNTTNNTSKVEETTIRRYEPTTKNHTVEEYTTEEYTTEEYTTEEHTTEEYTTEEQTTEEYTTKEYTTEPTTEPTTQKENVIEDDITFPQEEPSKPETETTTRPKENIIEEDVTFSQENPSKPQITDDDVARIDERPIIPTEPTTEEYTTEEYTTEEYTTEEHTTEEYTTEEQTTEEPTTSSQEFNFDVDHKQPDIKKPIFDDIIKDLEEKSKSTTQKETTTHYEEAITKQKEFTTDSSSEKGGETPNISTPERPSDIIVESASTETTTEKKEESSDSSVFDDLRKYLEDKTTTSEPITEESTTQKVIDYIEESTTEPVTEPTTEEETTKKIVEQPTENNNDGYAKPEIPTDSIENVGTEQTTENVPTTDSSNVIDDNIIFDQENLGDGIDFF